MAQLTAKADQIVFKRDGVTEKFEGDPLSVFQELLDSRPCVRVSGLPPFVGGAVGFLGFDVYRYIEPFSFQAQDDLKLPDLHFSFFDEAVVVDHLTDKLWIIVLAQPTGNPDRAYIQALARIEALFCRVTRSPEHFGTKRFNLQSTICNLQFQSTHTRATFEAMVRKAKGFIADGEIYQANLSQRFTLPLTEEPWDLYRRLMEINPSPFSAYADFGDFQLVCASPERFLRVRDHVVETRPIAGTRPKGRSAVETARLRQELIFNEKERAEHLMLVDLERNDLGKVCRYGSVRVDELMMLEEYSHVIHIVSNVRGVLRPEVRPVDLIAAAFPGGTITGCPKIRCIQIIDSLEPVRRGLYTGSLGYVSYSGEMDLNLLIRTACVVGDSVYLQTGAGIVADSDPGKEFEETLHKAEALLQALSGSTATHELATASTASSAF